MIAHGEHRAGNGAQPLRRKDLNLPDGWRVTRGAGVQVLYHDRLYPAGLAVDGRWHVVDRSPEGWWLQPSDDAAHRWLAVHGANAGAASGCVQVHALRLVPGQLQLGAR